MQELWIETGGRNYVVAWNQTDKTAHQKCEYMHGMAGSLINNGAPPPLPFSRTWRTNDCGSLCQFYLVPFTVYWETFLHLVSMSFHIIAASFFSLSLSLSLFEFEQNKNTLNQASMHQNPVRHSRLWRNFHSKQPNGESLNCKWEQFLSARIKLVPSSQVFSFFSISQPTD